MCIGYVFHTQLQNEKNIFPQMSFKNFSGTSKKTF